MLKNRLNIRIVNNFFQRIRSLTPNTNANPIILGIESSCDDTGCAIVDGKGNLISDVLCSQHLTHLNNGGIIPPLAQQLHRKNIERVVSETVEKSGLTFGDIDALAVCTHPGLPMSLEIGTRYGKHLCRMHKKPFIPIHHMKAHSLTCRMHENVEFPFLVLLISGGHSLLALAESVDDFLLMGESIDDSPGEALDKMARRMKLRNVPEFSTLSGGAMVELAASRATDPNRFKFSIPMVFHRDCNFSFAGIKNQVHRYIVAEEASHDLEPDEPIPHVYDLCAGFQLAVTRHMCHRVQRAMEYLELTNQIPEERKTLVVSGGVACNSFIAKALQIVCDVVGWRFVRTPPKLCTDNGIMIAWNGIERYKINAGLTIDYNSIDVVASAPIGRSIIQEIADRKLKCKWVRLSQLNQPQQQQIESDRQQINATS